jgi:hypothetical protein
MEVKKVKTGRVIRPRIAQKVRETVVALYKQGLTSGQIFKVMKGRQRPSLRSIGYILAEAKAAESDGEYRLLERSWDTSTLVGANPVDAESVPDLVSAQQERKLFLSKPLTVRDARWFSRLRYCGDLIKGQLRESTEDPETQERLRRYYVWTLAGSYSWREKIDLLSGVEDEDTDYSDLDASVYTGEWRAVYESKFKSIATYLVDRSGEQKPLDFDAKPEGLREALPLYMNVVVEDTILELEISYLRFCLGSPDLTTDGLRSYGSALLQVSADDEAKNLLTSMSMKQKINFFVALRQVVKQGDKPDVKATLKNVKENVK